MVDLTQNQVGQAACTALAELGADVVHVARPDYAASRGDHRRVAAGRAERSIALDLKDGREDREILEHLIRRANVVVEGFRPGTLDALGLGYAVMQRWRPGIILCSVSGYGQQGPYRRRPGHDLNFQAVAGALPADADGHPSLPTNVWANRVASLRVESAILSALLHQLRTSEGVHLDIAITEAAITLPSSPDTPAGVARVPTGGPPGTENEQAPHVRGQRAWYGVYRCADGAWLAIACVEPHYWRAFCHRVAREELAGRHGADTAGQRKLRSVLSALFVRRPRSEWLDLLAADLPIAPVNLGDAVTRDPHLMWRGAAVSLPVGAGATWQLGARTPEGRCNGYVTRALTLAGEDSEGIRHELGRTAAAAPSHR